MSYLTLLFAAIFYFATGVLLIGLVYKIRQYASVPAPLKIPTTPAPTTKSGVAFRMLKELTIFESLFKSNKPTWLFGWLFHFGLFLVLLRHLRYFTDPVWGWVNFIQPFGKYASFALILGLVSQRILTGIYLGTLIALSIMIGNWAGLPISIKPLGIHAGLWGLIVNSFIIFSFFSTMWIWII